MDGSLAEPVCPWYYPIPCLVSRPRVASLGIRERPNGGIARKNYVPALFRPDPRVFIFANFRSREKEKGKKEGRKKGKKERRKEKVIFFSPPVFPFTESFSIFEESFWNGNSRRWIARSMCPIDVRLPSWFVTIVSAVRNKNTYARFSVPLKTARLVHVGVHSFVFRTKIVLHLFKKTLFQDR